jgi:hypothetical protein
MKTEKEAIKSAHQAIREIATKTNLPLIRWNKTCLLNAL